MKFSLSLLCLVSTAAASSLRPRADPQILTDLKTCNADTQTLSKAVASYIGGLQQPPIQPYINALMQDYKNCTADAHRAASIPNGQLEICNYILTPLYNSTSIMLKNFVNKQRIFVSSGLGPTVYQDLQQFQNLTITCIQAINEKVKLKPSSNPCGVHVSQARYNDIYNNASSYFKS